MKAVFSRLLYGFLGGTVLSAAMPMLAANALSEAELFEKLSAVSVFVITNREGGFITRQGDFPADGLGNIELLEVFLTPSDAQAFAARLVEENPSFRGNGAIGLTNLATVYDFAAADTEIPRKLSLLPNLEDVRAATAIDPRFLEDEVVPPPVPLFTIEDPEGNPIALAFGTSEEKYISMFLSSQDAQGILDTLNAEKPELQAQLAVYSLKDFSNTLTASDNPAYEQVRFFQASEIINSNQTVE